jgi:hypothetical protein
MPRTAALLVLHDTGDEDSRDLLGGLCSWLAGKAWRWSGYQSGWRWS